MRRIVAALATPVLLIALAACGQDSPPEGPSDPPVAEAPQEPSDGGEDSPSNDETQDDESQNDAAQDDKAQDEESPLAEETSAEETSAEEETSSEEPESTVIETLWIDDSWTVEDLDEDLCEMGMSETIYSEQDDMFTCGPNAASADACALGDGEEVLCIVDALGKQAIRFTSPTAADPNAEVWPSEQQPVPMYAELPDGAICSTITHDHDQHWNGMFSWFACDDGSELLTEDNIDATFERGDPWIAQRSVDKTEPEATRVVTATYAGR